MGIEHEQSEQRKGENMARKSRWITIGLSFVIYFIHFCWIMFFQQTR